MGLACYLLFFTKESLTVEKGCLASIILVLSAYAVTVLEKLQIPQRQSMLYALPTSAVATVFTR
jgi:hypothetical protein